MTQNDLPRVVELERDTFSIPWSEEGFLTAMQRSENCFLVIEDEKGVQGYCGYYRVLDEAEIMNVCINKARRGQGLGSAMVEQLLKEAKEGGATRILLEVRVSNEPAIRVYKRLGFVPLGVRKGFYEKPVEDALIMQCDL
jgi:ribosomal-protein-alanine N-acetyltransferase